MDPIEAQLQQAFSDLHAAVPDATVLVDELKRLTASGGRRIRAQLCRLAHLAYGGDDSSGLHQASAAIELLHLFALIQDDVMDASSTRRGGSSAHVSLGTAQALLAADLAFVWADRLLRTAPFDPLIVAQACEHWDRMRLAAIAGQYLDVAGEADHARVAELKTASYSFVGPLCIGAALAGGTDLDALAAFGRPLGIAYQLADDLDDGDAPSDAAEQIERLRGEAKAALTGIPAALSVLVE